jgi:hypothetical protein
MASRQRVTRPDVSTQDAPRQDMKPISIPPVPAGSVFLDNVITAFVNAIPLASYFSCELRDGTKPRKWTSFVDRKSTQQGWRPRAVPSAPCCNRRTTHSRRSRTGLCH